MDVWIVHIYKLSFLTQGHPTVGSGSKEEMISIPMSVYT